MGVRGLSSFMNEHGAFEEIYLENKGRVLIDGNNLRFYLLERRLNSHYGMDYDKYGRTVREWFTAFISKGNSIILVFDGVGESNKEKTALSRKKEQIRASVSVGPSNPRVHISILAKDVFVNIAKSFPPSEILVLQTSHECDNIMANLAKKLNAPVLSNDSDFYIFNVEFIPLSTLDPESFKCSRFNKQAFMKRFHLSNESSIYLMASLLGNDYIPRSLLEHFYSQIHFPYKTKRMTPSVKRIFALLLWLGKSPSTDKALETFFSTFPMERRDKLKLLIQESMQVYDGENIKSSFKSLVSTDDIHGFVKEVNKPLNDPDGNSPSMDFIERFHSLDVDTWLGNVFVNRTLTVPIPIEEKTEETGFLFCAPIYKKIISLMTLAEGSSVKCLIRNKGSLQVYVHKIEKEALHSELTLDKEAKLNLILDTVGLSKSQLKSLSSDFSPESLIMGLALHYYSSLRKGASLYIKSLLVLLLLKAPGVLRETPLEGLNENFEQRMKVLFSEATKTKDFDRSIVHEFSLIQWCIHAVSHLNILLGHPVGPLLSLSEFWNGTFLYNFTKEVLGFMDRDARFNSLLTLRGADVSKEDQVVVTQALDRVMKRLSTSLPHFSSISGVSSTGKRPRNRKKGGSHDSNPREE
eukprot:TRINITY_DN10898_c0_g1_i1.p1 TRINITY_DN10898_c0_g1~~TRINITY_DN10898_c0_g1_i1.p1  ORF type:complete len:637 (+),score=136.31 TRINITY_DN10898_c0_g1_i1:79-1989(+)